MKNSDIFYIENKFQYGDKKKFHLVNEGKLYGIVDDDNKEIIPCKYSSVHEFKSVAFLVFYPQNFWEKMSGKYRI